MWVLKVFGGFYLCLITTVSYTDPENVSRHEPIIGHFLGYVHKNPWVKKLPTSQEPITVLCLKDQIVVMAHQDLFGTGHLVQEAELSLGSQACRYSSIAPEGDVIVFVEEYNDCGTELRMTPDFLIYRTSLFYNPISVRHSSVEIPVECQIPRKEFFEPPWTTVSPTTSVAQILKFSLRLMTDDWSTERTSAIFRQKDKIHIQAEVHSDDNLPLRLFVDSCVTKGIDTYDYRGMDYDMSYDIIKQHGCHREGKFRIPRLRPYMLQFSLNNFGWVNGSEIFLACRLKVTDKEPNHIFKACSFNTSTNSWIPVEGSENICSCCEYGVCSGLFTDLWSINNPYSQISFGSAIRDMSKGETEADIIVGPIRMLDLLDDPYDQGGKDGGLPMIEAEAESPIGPQFILWAEKELSWLDSKETVTFKGGLLHTESENAAAAVSQLSSDTDETTSDVSFPLQGIASEKGTVVGKLLTIGVGVLTYVLIQF